jgi:hypothetical protein
MKANRRLIIIIATFIIIIIGLMSLVFEIREVPDYNWYKKYKYDSKEPYGLWMFSELLKSRFGEENIIFNESDTLLLDDGRDNLYIVVGDNASYTQEQNDDLMAFAEEGNDVLIIASHSDLEIPLDSFYAQELYLVESARDLSGYDHLIIDEYGDTIYTGDQNYIKEDENTNEVNTQEPVVESGSYYDNSYYENPSDSILFISRFYFSLYDSIIPFDLTPFDSTESRYIYRHQDSELKKLKRTSISKFSIPKIRTESLNGKELIYTLDSLPFFIKLELGKGNIYFHSLPIMVTNIGTRQEYYLDHAEYLLSHFDPNKVIVDKTRINFNIFNDEIKKSPIAFILKTPSLAWAYYLTLAAILCFVIFRSKRLQRIIPLKEKNENTSLQYIKTLSTLYQGHEQNNKLVVHMRDVFFNKIKHKYFLDHTIDNYTELLSKKTKVSEKEISTLLHKFESAKNSDFTDDQLIVLHNQIESFHKKSK